MGRMWKMGRSQGDVESHRPCLWDGLNRGMGGSRTDGIWDKPEEATGVLGVLLGENGEAQGYRWPRKVVRVYQEQREESAVILGRDVCSVPTPSPGGVQAETGTVRTWLLSCDTEL